MAANEVTQITGVEAFVINNRDSSVQTGATRTNSSIEIPTNLDEDEPFVRKLVPSSTDDARAFYLGDQKGTSSFQQTDGQDRLDPSLAFCTSPELMEGVSEQRRVTYHYDSASIALAGHKAGQAAGEALVQELLEKVRVMNNEDE